MFYGFFLLANKFQVDMELVLHVSQLQLKSEYLHTNPKHIHFHEGNESRLFISWDDCTTVLYSLDSLDEASLWNPIKPVVSSCIRLIFSIHNNYFTKIHWLLCIILL